MKITPLDRLFSEFIRRMAIILTGGCERCLAPKHDIIKDDGSIFPAWKQLQCSHFWGRNKQSVRYDEDNGAGLCGACHMYLTAHPLEHVEFFKARLGEKFDLLDGRQRTPAHQIDREAIRIYLNARIKELTHEDTEQAGD